MKFFNLFLAVMFLVFAFVQVNDADPLLWIAIYGAMAVMAVLAAFKVYPRVVLVVLFTLYLAYSYVFIDGVKIWLSQDNKAALFDDVAKMQHPWIEESREFLGLAICLLVLIVYIVLGFRQRGTS